MPIAESHGHVMIKKAYCQSKTNQFVDCKVMQPVEWRGRIIQFSILEPVLTRKQIPQGLRKDYVWWIHKLLDINYNKPTTLEDEDIGLSPTMVEQVNHCSRRCSTSGVELLLSRHHS
eukprot:1964627-Rhodomonas_salina.2